MPVLDVGAHAAAFRMESKPHGVCWLVVHDREIGGHRACRSAQRTDGAKRSSRSRPSRASFRAIAIEGGLRSGPAPGESRSTTTRRNGTVRSNSMSSGSDAAWCEMQHRDVVAGAPQARRLLHDARIAQSEPR